MTIKHLLSITFLFFALQTLAQDKYVVHFTDKNNSAFSLNSPQNFLSQRSIDRRTHQGIAIDSTDLPVNSSYTQGVETAGATVIGKTKWLNAVLIQTTNPAVLTAINALPYVVSTVNVARIAPTQPTHNKFEAETIEPYQPSPITAQRTTSLDYGNGTNQINMININALHDLGFQGQGMQIAVIDAGFDHADQMTCFDSLRANNQLLGTWDFVAQDTFVYDDFYHGSAVLSCMGANVPGDLIGTAPKASFWLLRSEDVGSENIIEEYYWASAAEFADSAGADVINSSLGYTTFDISANDHTYAEMDGNTTPCTMAADFAAKKGIIVCNSAGNEGGSSWHYIGAPADADSILTVGAVDAAGNYVAFSSKGPTIDGRIKPDVADQGQGTTLFVWPTPTSQTGSGTSFSSPLMAGAVACLWQAWPNKTNMEIIQAVKQSSSQYNNPDDSLLGYGIPNFGLANLFVSTNYHQYDNVLNIFPNPIINTEPVTIQIVNDSQQVLNLELTDVLGRVCYSHDYALRAYSLNEIKFYPPFSKMGNGLFFLKMQTDDHSYLKRLMKL